MSAADHPSGPGLRGTLVGVIGLAGFFCSVRGRVRGPYMRWRMQTAYGDHTVDPATKRRDMLEFGRWWIRMRGMR